MARFATIDECLGYQTATDPTNTPPQMLVAGSKNVLIDQQKKVKSRAGYTRFGAGNAALTPVKYQAPTWNSSNGTEYPMRPYDTVLEVYLGTVDTTVINAYTQVKGSLSATAPLRFATWYDTTEAQDLLLFVQGDANIYEWGGGVAVVSSIPDGTHITKAGTTTWAQNRFYTTRNKVMVCVRTGTEYTYTAGETGLILTVTDSTGLVAGDVLVQKVVTQSNAPASGHTNDTIFCFNNQVYIGSAGDDLGYISKNTSYYDFTYSTPRLTGEGGLLTLDAPVNGFGVVGNNIVVFAGRSSMFAASYQQITVNQASTTPAIIAETLNVKKLNTGVDQSAQSQEVIIPIGNELAYLSFEPALRVIQNPSDIEGVDPKTYSNPIQPDFDGIDWTGASMIWFKNAIQLSARAISRLYILEFTQDADGKTRRFWQAPQILPVGALSIISDALYGHSNAVPETYELFSGGADGDYTDIPIADRIAFKAVALFAYGDQYFIPRRMRMGASRSALKVFDQYVSEGEILAGTKITLRLLYDFGGVTQIVQKMIDGEDNGIVFEDQNLSSLGQSSFGTQPLGGSSVEPSNTLRYRVVFDLPKEDYYLLQEEYSTEAVDAYFAVLSRGVNAELSSHRDTNISR